MRSRQFQLVTEWHFIAPLERVWDQLLDVETWPQWWPSVSQVETLRLGDCDGIGAVRRLTWTTALPYRLIIEMESSRIEPMSVIEGQARGELEGIGRWTLHHDGKGTHVRYDWQVDVTKPWMRLLAPLLRPLFAWNHRAVMAQGEAGLQSRISQLPE